MHPVLVEIPWPELGLPIWPAFALLALAGAAVGALAFRNGRRSAAALGAVLALASLAAALSTRGARFVAGPLEVRVWGVAFAASLAVGSAIALRRATKLGIERDLVARACIAAAIGAVVGARFAWVLLHPAATGSVEGSVAFYRGGLSVWGGLAGALAGAALSSRASGVTLPVLLDAAAPSFGAGVALTRLGCFFEGCDFGVPLSNGAPRFLAALGTFPKDSPAWVEHVLSRGLSPSASASLAVHPVELYEALAGVALVALALALDRRRLEPGLTFAAVTGAYLLLRVSLDWLRDDSVEMWVSRALLLLGAMVVFALWLRNRRAESR
jgi:phosphatidylglycerol:prolipoprotein diacylglycerol transferase